MVEWGAKTIPEGGFHSIPERLHGDGLLIAGDAAGLVNVASLKGIHYAMKSGILAGRAIFRALKAMPRCTGQIPHTPSTRPATVATSVNLPRTMT